MQVTYYGHACFEVKLGSHTILFDPFISPNPLAKDIDVDALKPDFILLSHGHEDHVADVERVSKNSGAKLVSNFEVVSWFQNQGVQNGHPMNHGGEWEFEFGTVKAVNAVHSSCMPDGSYGGNPMGFVIKTNSGTFYYAGDTALHYDMKLIGEEFDIDFAFLPIGSNFTMGYKDAVKAAGFVNTNKVIAMHYDTFPYIEINKDDAVKTAESDGKELVFFKIGETIKF